MQKNGLFPTILPRVRSPVIQKPFQPKSATSIVACVSHPVTTVVQRQRYALPCCSPVYRFNTTVGRGNTITSATACIIVIPSCAYSYDIYYPLKCGHQTASATQCAPTRASPLRVHTQQYTPVGMECKAKVTRYKQQRKRVPFFRKVFSRSCDCSKTYFCVLRSTTRYVLQKLLQKKKKMSRVEGRQFFAVRQTASLILAKPE